MKQQYLMKKIEVILRTSRLSTVKQALDDLGINFITFSDIKAFGKVKEKRYRGQVYDDDVVHRTKMEVVVPDDMLDLALSCIMSNAHTGRVGDGKVSVYPVEEIYRIRNGQKNLLAL